MVAKLIKKNNSYCCSECYMRQKIQPYCYFCGASFSNYEQLIFSQFVTETETKIKELSDEINE